MRNRSWRAFLVFALASLTLSCAGWSPSSSTQEINAALERGELRKSVSLYLERGTQDPLYDKEALEKIANAVIARGLRVGAPSLRAKAIRIVERHEIEAFAQEVMDKLPDPNDEVAASAAIAVLKSHPQAPQLASDLLNSPDPKVRAYVLRGIAKKIGSLARSDFIKATADESPLVRAAAIDGLAKFKNADDRHLILKATSDLDQHVRASALRALADKPNRREFEIAQAHVFDEYLGARLAALNVIDKVAQNESIPWLQALVQRPDADTRAAIAAAAILFQHTQKAYPSIVQAGLSAKAWSTRVATLTLLTKLIDTTQGLLWARKAMSDPVPQVQFAAAKSTKAFGDETTYLKFMIDSLESLHADTRLSAATELAQRGNPQAQAYLSSWSQNQNDSFAKRALSAHQMAHIVTPGLIKCLASPSTQVQLDAANVVLANIE